MSETILVLNAGSSSIKFQLFEIEAGDRLVRWMKGQIDGIGTRPRLVVKAKEGEVLVDKSWDAVGFLAANAAKLITGDTLYIDGGYHIVD